MVGRLVQRQLVTDGKGAEAGDVRVVAEDGALGRVYVGQQRGVRALDFVGRDGHAQSGSADKHTPVRLTGGHSLSYLERGMSVNRIIAAHVNALVAQLFRRGHQAFLQVSRVGIASKQKLHNRPPSV